MAISVEEFWRLAIESGLFAEAERQDLTEAFDRMRGGGSADAVALCKWLIERGMLTRYQAKLLTHGRSGPFHFGDYRVYDRVESGRLAKLFRASHLINGQPALLYFFSGSQAADPQRWPAVEAAAQAATKIRHPHISRADEVVNVGGYKFMALESLDGRSLAEIVRGKPMAPADVCRTMRKAIAGLARLHNLGCVHGAVRPDNILVDSSGQLKLLYFPLSHDPFAAPGADEQNADFLAPECASPHNRPPDARSDIYAVGATMYALLAGRPPFGDGDPADKARRRATEAPLPLEKFAKVPSSLSRLVTVMMAKNPAGRPSSAAEVAEAIQTILERKGAPAPGQPAAAVVARPIQEPAPAPPAPAFPAAPAPRAASSNGAPAGAMPPPAMPAPAMPAPPAAPIYAGQQPGAWPTAQPQPLGYGAPIGAPPGQSFPAAPPGATYGAWPAAGAMPAPGAMPFAGVMPVAGAQPIAGARPVIPNYAAPGAPMAQAVAAPTHAYPGPAVAAATLEPEQSYAEPARSRPTARREGGKRGGRSKKASGGPGVVALVGGVTVAVFLIVGYVAYSMMQGPKLTNKPDQAELAKLHQEFEAAEAGLPSERPTPDSTKMGEGDAPKAGMASGDDDASDEKTPSQKSNGEKPSAAKGASPRGADTLTLVNDDGSTLWASPTSGPPLDLRYIPPGSRVIMAVRPAAALGSPEGDKIMAALGPSAAAARQAIETIAGVPLGDMEQLLAAVYSLDEGPPQLALVVRLAKTMSEQELLAAWKNPSADASREHYYRGSKWAYYLPASGENKVFSVAPLSEMAEAGNLGDEAPELGKEMDKLARQTDASRTFTLLFAPAYLKGAGRSLMEGEFASLRDPLSDFLGDGVRAVELSLNWGDDFFAELRAYGADESPEDMARRLNGRINELSDRVERYTLALNPGAYSRFVLNRFPQMLRVASEFTRNGADDNQALVRCFLPMAAGHNLLMASELLLSQGAGPAGGAVATKKIAGPADALQQKITLSFSRDTLEKCMEYLSKEIDTEIVIVGGDLQLEGITKNQSFGLDEKDKPAGEILRTVMLKANPDGKLVYVFKPKEPGGKDVIFITTRASVAKNKYTLPPELERGAPDAKKK